MTKQKFLFWTGIIALFHIALVLYFGAQKQGFHEDEYYTYSSVSTPDSLNPVNLTWHSGYDLQRRFLVNEETRFSYPMVVANQAADVHPPLYYMALHTFMSLFPNRFYKWFGILLNLFFSLISYAGITYLFYRLGDTREASAQKKLALLAGFTYAAAPSTISCIMLARMYAMSSMWTILYTVLFYLLIINDCCPAKKFRLLTLSGAALCYCAFLTHYYALFVPFFLTLCYCIYMLVQKKHPARMLLYGITALAAIGLAVLTYPASLSHIFRGYRGKGAVEDFLADSLFGRAKLFTTWLNDSILGGWLIPCVLVFLVFAVAGILIFARRPQNAPQKKFMFCMLSLGITLLLSYWLLTKVSLMAGESASRYFYPVFAVALPFMAYTVGTVTLSLRKSLSSKWQGMPQRAVSITFTALVCIAVMLPFTHAYLQEKVLFLYREDEEKVSFSQEYSKYPLILAYDNDVSYRSWYVDNQVWPFEKVLYVENDSFDAINDPTISSAEKVIIYMDAPEENLQLIMKQNPNLSSYRLVRHDPFFYVYLLE